MKAIDRIKEAATELGVDWVDRNSDKFHETEFTCSTVGKFCKFSGIAEQILISTRSGSLIRSGKKVVVKEVVR